MFKSKKRTQKYSCCFRQWRAEDTHCSFLHGYAIYFEFTFSCKSLDDRNWVQDFGFISRSKTEVGEQRNLKEWFSYMFDHTTIIANDDPESNMFITMDELDIIQLRFMKNVGCEMFAKEVFDKVSEIILEEGSGRVILDSVECFEHELNSAIYINSKI